MEIKKLTFEGLTEALDGRGGQVVLKNLGMPKGKNGRLQRPSNAWISTFRNHDYMYFRHELDRELRDTVLPKGRKNHVLLTCDSTPAEASRYSKWAQYNVHYEVRMCKVHIIMADGVPLVWDVTNGNAGDNPEFRKLLKRFSRRKSVFTAGFPKYVIKRSLSDRVVRERDSEANAASFSKEASQRQFL